MSTQKRSNKKNGKDLFTRSSIQKYFESISRRILGKTYSSLAIVSTLRTVLDNDDSRIVSKKGRVYLNNSEKMEEINSKIRELETGDQYSEIII